MKHYGKILMAVILFFAVAAFGYTLLGMPGHAGACGWGTQGGAGYVPQQRNSPGPLAQRSFLTQAQALDIVKNHIKKLNPDLEVGRINDAGSFFEAQILSKDKEVIQLLGVDKESGRLLVIN